MEELIDRLYYLSDQMDDAITDVQDILKKHKDAPKDVVKDLKMIEETLHEFGMLCSDTAYDLSPEEDK